MSDAVMLALIAQIGTLVTVLVTAFVGRRKLNEVHKLVNGQSTAQIKLIERQSEAIAGLATRIDARRNDGVSNGKV